MIIAFRQILNELNERVLLIQEEQAPIIAIIEISANKIDPTLPYLEEPKLWGATQQLFDKIEDKFTGDINKHTETGFCAPLKLKNGWVLIGTDVCDLGGQKVESDGGYLITDKQKLIKLGYHYDSETGEVVDYD